jgi:hypothetical protein
MITIMGYPYYYCAYPPYRLRLAMAISERLPLVSVNIEY